MKKKPVEWSAAELALLERLIAEGVTRGQAMPHFPGRSVSSLWGAAKRRGLKWPRERHRDGAWNSKSRYPPERAEPIRQAWEDGEMTATQIGAAAGVSKSAIIGLANRRGWSERAVSPVGRARTTLAERMDALNAMMDRVLAETRGVGRIAG